MFLFQNLQTQTKTKATETKAGRVVLLIGRLALISLAFLSIYILTRLWNRPIIVPSFTPGYLPEGYLAADGFEESSRGGRTVIQVYQYSENSGETDMLVLAVKRYRFPLWLRHNYPDQPPAAQEVTIKGKVGSWVEDAPVGSRINAQSEREVNFLNLLFWQERDQVISIQSRRLPLQEMTRIAEALVLNFPR